MKYQQTQQLLVMQLCSDIHGPRMMDRDAFGDLLKVFVGLKDSREPCGVYLVFGSFVFSAVNLCLPTKLRVTSQHQYACIAVASM